MWYCQCVADEGRKFVILPGKEYVLGRRDCDIVIENDQSVSRKHASLQVIHPESNVTNLGKPAAIILKDLSKFGTFVNNVKVKGEKVLRTGDEIRLGTPKSVHRVVYKPFVVTTSCLDGADKKGVRSLVCQVGGHVSNDWRKDCSVLIMKTITVTIKTVCALIAQKPIVTVNYLRDLVKYLNDGEKGAKPDPQKYLPSVTERLVGPGVSFQPTAERSTIFLGMTFYFLCEKQFKKISMAVELGGGVPILSDDPKTADLEGFLEDKTVVMNPTPGEVTSKAQKDWVEKVKTFLQKKDKHMVQDAEVGYAVLYCSTEDYCNADKESGHLLSMPLPSQSLTQMGSLASQALNIGSQASHQAPFRKPGAVTLTGGRNVTVPVKHGDSSGREVAGFGESQPGKSGPSMTIKSGEVFIVPESLTEETPKVKGQGQKGGRSSSSATVQSIKEEPTYPDESSTVPSRSCDAVGTSEPAAHNEATETAVASKRQTRSRSPAKSLVIIDTETSQAVSQMPRGRNRAAVKLESGALFSHPPTSSTMASEVLFDSELPAVSKIKKERVEALPDSKPVLLLDDEDDDDDVVTMRKPAPSKKRKMQDVSSEEEEDNPFDFVKKRTKKSPSPAPPKSQQEKPTRSPSPELQPRSSKRNNKSPSPIAESRTGTLRSRSPSPVPKTTGSRHRNKSPSPVPEPRTSKRKNRSPSPVPEPRSKQPRNRSQSPVPEPRNKQPRNRSQSPAFEPEQEKETSKRSASPKPQTHGRTAASISRRRNEDMSDEEAPLASTSSEAPLPRSSQRSERPSQSQNGHHEPSVSHAGPVPHGFLTTRQPIEDQVQVNPRFEKENIDAPVVLVEFEDLVVRPGTNGRHKAQTDDQSDVPEGMMCWQGQLVCNFKKFSKVKHVGAGQLPRIIGGRDLVEHSTESRQAMDDWLKNLQEAESQQSQRDREAEQLFNWQPPSRAKTSTSSKAGGKSRR